MRKAAEILNKWSVVCGIASAICIILAIISAIISKNIEVLLEHVIEIAICICTGCILSSVANALEKDANKLDEVCKKCEVEICDNEDNENNNTTENVGFLIEFKCPHCKKVLTYAKNELQKDNIECPYCHGTIKTSNIQLK